MIRWKCARQNCFCLPDDLGLEVAPTNGKFEEWFCWFRSDTAGRYHRFIHLRHLRTQKELTAIISALIGYEFKAENALYGSLANPKQAERLRKEYERLDLRMRHESPDRAKWLEVEKDDSRGRALPEHLEAHATARAAA